MASRESAKMLHRRTQANTGNPSRAEDAVLKERSQSGEAAKSINSNTKSGSAYRSRDNRLRNSSLDGTTGLTNRQQQSRDLLGEDYEAAEGATRGYRPPLQEWEMADQTVQQLESEAILRSQDVTQNIRDCMRIAEDTKGVAAGTMEMLHEQGEQIKRTHVTAVKVEEELTVGEKLLGSLGGMFSRRWKPKKPGKIKGPQADVDPYKRTAKMAQGERAAVLGDKSDYRNPAQAKADRYSGLSAAQVQLEMEKEKQDEALSNLGSVVSQLKNMTREMNEEVEKQTTAIGQMEGDVDIINNRVKQSYNRTRYLVGR